MRCNKCNSTSVQYDHARGESTCTVCGIVLEENAVVADFTFENTKVQGIFVGENHHGGLKNFHGNMICDSWQIRLNKAYKEIQRIANQLLLKPYHIEEAKRLYETASFKLKFIQGRKTKHVVAVLLYIVCRLEKTPHLLIDFSDILQTNLYILGSIYLKLIKLLNLKIPLIDPSLYIHRFCNRLDFKEKTQLVVNTSLNILKSMKRDWIHIGRRPSGLCGAAILISARCHGFKRTTQQIINVVNVCDETIRRRLDEFSKTESALMTLEEFEKFVGTKAFEEGGMDPPCYKRTLDVEYPSYQTFVQKKAKEIESALNNTEDNKSVTTAAQTNNLFFSLHQGSNQQSIGGSVGAKEVQEVRYFLRDTGNRVWDKGPHYSEELSDIDEEEDLNYFLTEDEYKLKAMIWDVMFKEWKEDQKVKKEREKRDLGKKRMRKMTTDEKKEEAKTPVEAILNSKKFGKRLNKNRVKDYLFKKSSKL